MRKLFLHIGHGKTGSSMIQSSFRASRAALEAEGILYGRGADDGVTDERRITSGNGTGLTRPGVLAERLAPYAGQTEHLLYSSEMLFPELSRLPDPRSILDGAEGFDRIEILLFVRNPMEHAASLWQQRIKRSGQTQTIEEAFETYDMPKLVANLLDRLSGEPRIALRLRNYSVCGNRLLAESADWLGVPEATLAVPQAERVNRSMTRSELELQLAFNRILGRSGELVSDPLCEQLPEVPSDRLRPAVEVQQKTWRRLAAHIERANAALPEGHRYGDDTAEPDAADSERLEFSRAQIAVLAESLCRRMQAQQRVNRKLKRLLDAGRSTAGS